MKTIKTEIDIQAPAETVWEMLSDIDAFPSRNPFITRLEGEVEATEGSSRYARRPRICS
jgi:uncharacterized protein YndB with AHSA1/START domain